MHIAEIAERCGRTLKYRLSCTVKTTLNQTGWHEVSQLRTISSEQLFILQC